MADKTKILSSPAVLLIGAVGAAEGAMTNVGYTRGGVSISKTRATRNVEADQVYYPLQIVPTAESFEIKFSLLEITYANLQLAWGEPGAGKLGLSISTAAAQEKKVVIYGTRADGVQVKWTFFRCMLTTPGAFIFSKGDEGLIEATLTALWDDGQACIGTFSPATEA